MRTHLDPLDPDQSSLRPAIQRISQLSTSLNPVDDSHDSSDALAEQIRWALQLPELIRQLVREGERDRAEKEVDKLRVVLARWENVRDTQELLNQCKAALAFGE